MIFLVSEKNRNKVCIGWSGSFTTIIHFQHAIPALLEIKKKYPDKVYFKVIGDGSYVNEELDIVGLPWRKETEIEDLSEIDIGLMPLPDEEWSNGKCGLKGLQYMALNIPTIMSPVGVNSEIIEHGKNGFLADGVEEWVDVMSQLIENADNMAEIGDAGRKTVEERFSVESQKNIYLEYLNGLVSD